MRILIASDLHWPTVNGIATFGRNLAHGLAANGHEVVVVAPSQTGKKYEEIDGNHRVIRAASMVFPFYQNLRICLSPNREIKQIVKTFRPDVIHLQTPLGVGLGAIAAGKKYHVPIVATNHAMSENLIDNLKLLAPFARQIDFILREYGNRFYNNADMVTLPTEAAIKMLKKSSFNRPHLAISNGIDLARFSPGEVKPAFYHRYGLPTDKPIVMYLGRVDAEKHLSVFVKAFHKLSETGDVHGLVVGFGNDLDNLKRLALELDIVEHITFTGKADGEDLPNLYRTATVFAMSSPAELQSLATLEAMASGLPVVAVNAGALYELCHDGENGYLFKLDDAVDMAGKLRMVLDDPKRRERMAAESLKIAGTHDITNVIEEFESLYGKVVKTYAAKSRKNPDT